MKESSPSKKKKISIKLAEEPNQVKLEKETHYEDAELDPELRSLVPMLRRITIQREIDEKRAAEMKRQAKLHREMLEK